MATPSLPPPQFADSSIFLVKKYERKTYTVSIAAEPILSNRRAFLSERKDSSQWYRKG
jgi:hypothetical protein